jgi:hypothetical protein
MTTHTRNVVIAKNARKPIVIGAKSTRQKAILSANVDVILFAKSNVRKT